MTYREELLKYIQDFDKELLDYSSNCIKSTYGQLPKLYRYMPANYDSIRSFETKKIYLAPVGTLNDAFEGFTWPGCSISYQDMQLIEDSAYIKSFTENADDLLMWGVYADSYKGFCVEYDMNTLPETSPIFNHLFPVIYSNERVINSDAKTLLRCMKQYKKDMIEESALAGYDAELLKEIMINYCNKCTQWSHENEWRLIVTYLQMHEVKDPHDESEHDVLYSISTQLIDFDCTSALYLGVRMRQDIKDHICEIATRVNCERDKGRYISVYDTYLSESAYKIINTPLL